MAKAVDSSTPTAISPAAVVASAPGTGIRPDRTPDAALTNTSSANETSTATDDARQYPRLPSDQAISVAGSPAGCSCGWMRPGSTSAATTNPIANMIVAK